MSLLPGTTPIDFLGLLVDVSSMPHPVGAELQAALTLGAKHKAGRAPGLKETDMVLWDESGFRISYREQNVQKLGGNHEALTQGK